MAAGMISKPGTKYGPCEGECEHTDCAASREMVAGACAICDKPIGYESQFFCDDGIYRHEGCVWEQRENAG